MPVVPSFAHTTKLVARALGLSPAQLQSGLRTATAADLQAVLAFRQTHIANQVVWDDAAYLRWRYGLGDTGPGLGPLWLLLLEGRIAAIVGAEHLQLQSPQGLLPALRTMDILVDPALHHCGLGVWLNQVLFRPQLVNLAVGANPNSIGTVTRLYAPVTPRQEYVHALDFRRVPMGRAKIPGVGALVRRMGNPIMRLWRLVLAVVATRFTVTQLLRFSDAELAHLDDALARAQIVDIRRSADFLNHRAFDNPRSQYIAFAARRNNKLEGYVIWKCVTPNNSGDSWAYILDMHIRPGAGNQCVAALLSSVFAAARKQGCTYISCTVQRPHWRSALAYCGFFKRKHNPFRLVGFHSADAALSTALQASAWGFTELCSDQDSF